MADMRTVDVAATGVEAVWRGYLVAPGLASTIISNMDGHAEFRVRCPNDTNWSSAHRVWSDSDATETLLRVDSELIENTVEPVHRLDSEPGEIDTARQRRDDCIAQYGPDHQQTVVSAVNLARAARDCGQDELGASRSAADSIARVWGDEFSTDGGIADLAAIAEPGDPEVAHRMLLAAVRSHDEPALALLRYEWLRAAFPLSGPGGRELIERHLGALAGETAVAPDGTDVFDVRFSLAEQCAAVDAARAVELFSGIVRDSENAEVDTEKTIHARYLLGIVLASRGKLRRAVATMEQVLEDYIRVCGAESAPVRDARVRLADIHMQRQDARSAIPHLEWFVSDDGTLRDRAAGAADSVRFELAIAYRTAGHVTRALPLLQRLGSEIDAGIHDDPHEVVAVRHELAKVHEVIGDWEHAIPLYERARDDARALLPDDDPLVVITANDTARAWAENGQADRARDGLRQLVTDSRRLHGEDHMLTVIVARNLEGLTDQPHTV